MLHPPSHSNKSSSTCSGYDHKDSNTQEGSRDRINDASHDKEHADSKNLIDDASSQENSRKEDDRASLKSDRSERCVYSRKAS